MRHPLTDYATLLRDYVTLKIRSIDRIFLQAYVPNLQTVGLVCRFLRWQRNFRIPSSAAFGQIGEQYTKAIDRFAANGRFPGCSSGRDKTKRNWLALIWKPQLERARIAWS
jgi:hypothetical protein